MADIILKTPDYQAFMRALREAPQRTADELGRDVNASLQLIENAAKHEAPVNKAGGGGNLRQNIRARMAAKLRGYVEALAPYSIFVHEGTRPHIIRPRGKKALAFEWTKGGGFQAGQVGGKIAFVKPGLTRNGRVKYHSSVVLQEVHHPGTKANPFFDRAIERTTAAIDKIFEDGLQRVLDFIAK